jgi:hypothetical protein
VNYFINTGYSNGMCDCLIGVKLSSEFILNNGKTSIPINIFKPERYYGMKFNVPKYYSFDLLDRLSGEWKLL